MSNTLKIGKSAPVLPGLALPEAFLSLDNRLGSTLQLCALNGTVDGPLLSLVTVCQEMQTLLKFAFVENGLLASRIEILTRYQTESSKAMERKLTQVELSHKTTKKQVKLLRKRLSVYETLQRKKHQKWWDVKVNTTDYDSFSYLARGSGCPDLEFMLRINQILIDFVNDPHREELVLPPMGNEERAELSKLASTYKLRCRFGKSTNLAPSTLIKARQTTIPNGGEVDAVLDTFARTHKRTEGEEALVTGSQDVTNKDAPPSLLPTVQPKGKPGSPRIEIPSTMLTPLSTLTSPTDVGTNLLALGQSPPTSGLSTPTAESAPKLQRLGSNTSDSSNEQKKTKDSGTHDNPHPINKGKTTETPKPIILRDPRLNQPPTSTQGPLNLQQQLQYAQLQQQSRALNLTGAQVAGGTLGNKTFLSSGGGILFQHQGQLRSIGHPAVVASPVKVAGVTPGGVGKKNVEGEGSKRDTPSVKRIRLTRKSAGGLTEQEQ